MTSRKCYGMKEGHWNDRQEVLLHEDRMYCGMVGRKCCGMSQLASNANRSILTSFSKQ